MLHQMQLVGMVCCTMFGLNYQPVIVWVATVAMLCSVTILSEIFVCTFQSDKTLQYHSSYDLRELIYKMGYK